MKKFVLLLAFVVFSFSVASAQTMEWRQMNSAITAFAHLPGNPDVIFAGDAAGLIRKSYDKGANWQMVSLQSESQINDIAFLDDKIGFATTAEWGLILKTTDGGNTWSRQQIVTDDQSFPVRNIHRIVVVDDKTAFFDIFNHPISAPSGKVGIVTRDGGLTFKSDTTPGEVYHVSGSMLMAFGRQVVQFGLSKFTTYKSTDKGLTWDSVRTSPVGLSATFDNNGIQLAHFLNENEFYITANISIGNDGFVYKTTDGGQTFAQLDKFPSGDPEYIYFKNATEGFAIAGSNSTRSTFTTSDGGVTWVQSDKNMQYAAEYLGNDTFISYSEGRTAISTDFGKTWTPQSDPINTSSKTNNLPRKHFLKVFNDSVAFAAIAKSQYDLGSRGELMKTTNGGLTWNILKNSEGKFFQGMVFHFVSPDTFFFIGSGYKEGSTTQGGYMKIKLTTDGGLTSQDIFTGSYQEDVQEIIFIDKNNAVTYSSNASFTNFSSDGGKTWASTPYSGLGQVTKMVFPSVNAWYATNTNSKFFKSTDKGKTWTDLSVTANCGSTYFIDEMTGFIYGCRKIYKTTDGGQTWMEITDGLSSQIMNNQNTEMAFKNSNIGFMSDAFTNSFYNLSKTSDGGNTWQAYTQSQLNVNVVKIDFKDKNTGAMLNTWGGFARYVGQMTFVTDTAVLNAAAVSVAEFLKENTLSIYPNPANDYVVVKSGDEAVQSVEISNVMGQILLKSDFTNAENLLKVSTENFINGVYFMKITTAHGVVLKPFHIVR